jgi:hypothetical protein
MVVEVVITNMQIHPVVTVVNTRVVAVVAVHTIIVTIEGVTVVRVL